MIPHKDFPVVLLLFFLQVFTPHKMLFLFSSNFVFLLFENVRSEFMVSLQSIIWVFLLNNFSRAINLLSTKLARDHPGRISALGLFCTALSPYCQALGPIFSQYRPCAWLIRYIYLLGMFTNHSRVSALIHYLWVCPPTTRFLLWCSCLLTRPSCVCTLGLECTY